VLVVRVELLKGISPTAVVVVVGVGLVEETTEQEEEEIGALEGS